MAPRTLPSRLWFQVVGIGLVLGCFLLPSPSLALTPAHDQPPEVRSELVFGGSKFESVIDIAIDAAGNSYILGITTSVDFPTFPALDSPDTSESCRDPGEGRCPTIFLVRLAADGQTVDYSTLIGSFGINLTGLAVAPDGSVAIAGHGTAAGFTTDTMPAGALRTAPLGEEDAFVALLDPRGRLIGGGYLGGSAKDITYGLARGPDGDIYLTGQTFSTDFPTVAAFQPTLGDDISGGQVYGDAFISRISADLSRIMFSTYLGGRANDSGQAVTVGADGSAYVSGATESVDFPLAAPFQGTIHQDADATPFVTALSDDGATLRFSTYVGGSPRNGGGHAIALSGHGHILVAISIYQTGAVALLAADGSRLFYEQYLGPIGDVAFDEAGDAYAAVAPYPNKSGFHLPPGAAQPPCALTDTHIVRLDTTGAVQATIVPAAKRFALGPGGMLLFAGHGNPNEVTRIGPPIPRFGPPGADPEANSSDVFVLRVQADREHQAWQWPPVAYGGATMQAFADEWRSTDGYAAQAWLWGPEPLTSPFCEEFKEKPVYFVQYFDKGRMEWNISDRAPFQTWVMGGRLVAEMLSGQAQIGMHAFLALPLLEEPIAGDPAPDNPTAPTYRALAQVAWPQVRTSTQPSRNRLITSVLHADGTVSNDPNLGGYAMRYGPYDRQLGHNIAQVFAVALTDLVGADWRTTIGLPLSEPYWIRTEVNGDMRDILVQPFERRMLTYNPANAPEWQVEFGNAGKHYLHWRYNIQP